MRALCGLVLDLAAIVMAINSQFGELTPNPTNPRTISAGAMQRLQESISRDPEFMRLRPIVIGADGTVLGGNQRLQACMNLGMERLPDGWVVRADDITPEQARRFILIDNAPDGMSGEWDAEALARDYSFEELDGLGFDLADLRAFDDIGQIMQDEAPDIAPDAPVSRCGALYRLGGHRLLCGDAAQAADVERLTGGIQMDMCFTDPPYNVAYEGEAGTMANDDMSPEAFAQLLRESMRQIVRATAGGVYVCMSTKEMPVLRAAFVEVGGYWSSDIVWVKDTFTLGRGDYQQQFEPIMYGWRSGTKDKFFTSDRNEPNVWENVTAVQTIEQDGQTLIRFMGFEVAIPGRVEGTIRRQKAKTDIWRFDKPRKSPEHPTMKPVALAAQAIRNSSKRGGTVLDTFAGSGSTILACEQLHRRCFAMEIDPRYCDVIRKRYCMATTGAYDGWAEATPEVTA